MTDQSRDVSSIEPETNNASILVVDDDEAFRDCMMELLRQSGYSCSGAPSGEAALTFLDSVPFDLVLTDLYMPGNYNLELLRSLNLRGIPVIVVTAYPDVNRAIEAASLSASDYLAKPVSFGELLSKVKAVVGARRQVS